MKEMVVEVIQNRFNQLLEVNLEADVVDVWKEFRELCISDESNITWPLSIFSSIDSGLILLLRRNAVGVMRRKDDLEVLFSLEAISEFGNLEVAEVQAVFEVKLLLNDTRQFLADRQNSFFRSCLKDALSHLKLPLKLQIDCMVSTGWSPLLPPVSLVTSPQSILDFK